jgi:ankyrin repeat protein
MFVALMAGNLKCVEALLTSEYLDLETKDSSGNSIYHTCAEYNNFEALRVFLTKKEQRFVDPLYIRNNHDDNVVHTAAQFGNLEIIKIVVSKIFDGFSSLESYLTSKNSDGNTCFHIACLHGHFNIVEYFLRDLKCTYFLEQVDSASNTPLHVAAVCGQLSIVEILLAYNADLNTKNKDGNTALELSCRKGFFEISKTLIMRYSSAQSMGSGGSTIGDTGDGENPLHIACHEGAYEVVELLLSKGAPIDTPNRQGKNCLDIAVSQGHRDVVRVLLTDKDWHKLIHTNTNDRSHYKVNVMNLGFKKQINRFKSSGRKENPQLVAMFEKKMWDSIKLVLDKSRMSDNQYDFR